MDFITVVIGISTFVGVVSLAVASVSLRTARRLTQYQRWPYETLTQLEAAVDELNVQTSQHHERLRKVNARLAARDRRFKDSEDDEPHPKTPADSSTGFARQPGETELEWKRRMRAAIATGAIKHG